MTFINHAQQMKGGTRNMENMENQDDTNRAVVCPTKAGNGFKVRLPGGEWLYASKKDFFDMVNGARKGCTFSPIDEPRE